MDWVTKAFKDFRLYAVTDLNPKSSQSILSSVDLAYQGGADIVQLRAKSLPAQEMIRLGKAIRRIAVKHKKLYFVNDSVSVAFLTQAHGLHVGQGDLPPVEVRKICRRLNHKILLGLSTHSLRQARDAQKEPIDYFAVGPVFKTPTKPNYNSVGLDLVKKVSRLTKKPWVSIGGIDMNNIDLVLNNGAKRIAVVRAIFSSKNIKKSSRNFSKKLRGE